MLHRFLPAVPLALVLLAVDVAPAGAVRARGTPDQCVVTWGTFCPVETIGLSLLGSLALAALGFAVWYVLAMLRDRAGRSGLAWVAALLGLAARYPAHSFAVVVLGVAALYGL